MKRVITTISAVAIAAIAQAASVTWKVEGIQVNGDWDSQTGDNASGYLVYLFDNAGSYSRSDMVSRIAAGTWTDALSGSLGNFVGGDDGDGTVSNLSVADSDFTGYMVIFDAGTTDEAKNAYVTKAYTVTDNSLHKMDFKTFDDGGWINATASGEGTGWTAVPEPTSGLLLLLGLSGLALKRKNA